MRAAKVGDVYYALCEISDAELDALLKPNEEGRTLAWVQSYPMYITPSGRTFPHFDGGIIECRAQPTRTLF